MRYLFDDCVLDTTRRELHRGVEAISIAPQVLDLLAYLIRNRERVVSKDDIIAAVWDGRVVSDSALTTRLKVARSAIGDSGEVQRLIKTLPRKGFRFVGGVREEPETVGVVCVEQPRPIPFLPDNPSIVVPLTPKLGSDPEHEVDTESPAVGDAAPSAVAVRSGGPERRQLTILVCNMVGSEALSAGLDPEDMRDRIAPFHKMVADMAARFDGFIAQYLGDGVHVYFGYPAAHEHDAEQAVRAGLAIRDAVGTLKASSGETLQARVGIATGQVVVGEQLGTGSTQQRVAIGETPNLAAQLLETAPGEVVIAASTRRLVGRMFDCRPLDAIEVRGQPQLVEAWRVRGETIGVNRFKARRTGELTPLVGRQEEIELLLRRWDQAKAGEGRVVLLSGEPGIGKSRIAESLLVRLEGEPHVRFRYFCSPHHTHSPMYPFIAHLERAARFEPGSSASARLDKLEALLRPTTKNTPRDVPLIAELLTVPAVGPPELAVSPQQKREMILSALLDHLGGVAARSPVLAIFEDVHWIDPTSLDMLDRAIGNIPDLSVLLVVTFRPEFQPTWVGQPHVTMLPLSRLSRRDSAGMIGGVAEGKALPDEVSEQILARTDGVPLFIEELTNTMLESGLMRETPDRYVLDGPLPPRAIPATLQASLVARLDRLATVKDVVQIGAAIGREFSYELIAAVASLTSIDIDAALGQLTSSGLVHRRGTPPDATYSFKHALVQDAAYATLLKSQRQRLHASIAKVLIDRFPKLVESTPEIAAHHFTAAGLAEAVGYWRKAGQLATIQSANREAVNFFEKALGALKELPESQPLLAEGFEIRLELRRVLIQLGETKRVLEQVREAETLAEKLNDDNRRGRVCAFMTNAHAQLGELDEPLVWASRALAIADTLGSAELRILTTTYLEMVHYYRGEYERVIELATKNLASVNTGHSSTNFGAAVPASVFDRHCLIMSLAQLGRFADAAENETEAIRLAEVTNHAFTVALAHFPAHTLQILKGDWATARTRLERGIQVLRDNDLILLLPTVVACSTWVLAQLGEVGEALSRLREGERLLEREDSMGYAPYRGWAFHALGRACLLLDRLDEAQLLGDRAVESCVRQPGFAAHAFHLLGDIAVHSDRFDAKKGAAYYRKALSLAESLRMRPLIAHCHLGFGKLNRRTGKRKQSREHLAAAAAMYQDLTMRFWLEHAEAEIRQP